MSSDMESVAVADPKISASRHHIRHIPNEHWLSEPLHYSYRLL